METISVSEKLPKLCVRTSKIHNTGVFAAQDINEDQKIIEYKGEKIPSKEGDRRSEIDEKLTYIFILDDKFDIDGSVNGNNARLVNHSCKPNAYIDILNGRTRKDIPTIVQGRWSYVADSALWTHKKRAAGPLGY